MEAPEKIYLNPLLMEDGESVVRRCTFERQRDNQIEYTRTDAFIEKARNWLNEHIYDYECEPMGEYPRLAMLDDFEKAMKGE